MFWLSFKKSNKRIQEEKIKENKEEKEKMTKKKNNRFAWIAILSGLFLMILSLLAYFYYNVGFVGEVHSEVFGVGAALLVLGIGYYFWRVKLA